MNEADQIPTKRTEPPEGTRVWFISTIHDFRGQLHHSVDRQQVTDFLQWHAGLARLGQSQVKRINFEVEPQADEESHLPLPGAPEWGWEVSKVGLCDGSTRHRSACTETVDAS